eukprot:TRINITY_DN10_c0_g2_i1.p1 TRINITY_DN10_c0_g2~~TRINITY_DN10_c0_g2_i1.p1  ORF type:complete len:572 (-),score=152.25 TRINITY_DN10_c0_g2_i1:91-1806(-)
MTTTELDRRLHESVMKREAWKEEEFRRQRKKHEEEVQLGFGGTEMSKEEMRKLIDSDRRMYYRSEELNDKLFIHYKGWKELRNLEGWTGLKALYAECNAFDRISGLENCRSLRSLFLQENCIKKISGLENCPMLWNLNLNSNFIERIEGLSHLKHLNTLTIQKNRIGFGGLDDLLHLVETPINTLDLQDNKIWDCDVVPEVLMQMQDLRVLYLKGNPCSKKIPNYRKGITAVCGNLRYLDDRPVFPEDRRAADAFNRGGLEEERAERRRIRQENVEKHDRNMQAFQDMVDRVKREKRERDAMRLEDKYTDDTDPVESREKRMQKQIQQWKDENADELRDTDRERAEASLKAEKEGRSGVSCRFDEAEFDAGNEEECKESREAEASNQADSQDHTTDAEEPEEKNTEDNRKLVYEDIWDEPPMLSNKAVSSTSSAKADCSPPARQPSSSQDAASSAPFLPWATDQGASGMESLGGNESEIVKRAAQMAAKTFNPPSRTAGSAKDAALQADVDANAGKPTWYSRYSEKIAHTEAKLRGGAGQAMEEAKRAQESEQKAAPATACDDGQELDEMD